MTEQQADALMLWISDLTRVYGNEGPELEALTELCRHRDYVLYRDLRDECYCEIETWFSLHSMQTHWR